MVKIMAVVSAEKNDVGGGAPIFYARDAKDLEHIVHMLEKITDCMAHQLRDSLYILVDRHNK